LRLSHKYTALGPITSAWLVGLSQHVNSFAVSWMVLKVTQVIGNCAIR